MKHEEIKKLITPYLEGELGEEEKKLVESHLASCEECQKEFEDLNQLEEVLNKMKLQKPSKEIWDVYWSSVYNRLERKIGWIILSIGLIILIIIGAYPALANFISNPETPLLLKIGFLIFTIGGIIVFVSILREQLFFHKRDRYKEVKK
ncbi:MAG: zf-HC2 domain-containing protein [Candidatus Aminicenantes bacterium]|nr:zf-HC2 domain-containing protein [Candidatus Aminicenantes bacterium]